jgi:hypothetical protein
MIVNVVDDLEIGFDGRTNSDGILIALKGLPGAHCHGASCHQGHNFVPHFGWDSVSERKRVTQQ